MGSGCCEKGPIPTTGHEGGDPTGFPAPLMKQRLFLRLSLTWQPGLAGSAAGMGGVRGGAGEEPGLWQQGLPPQ